MRLCLFTVLRKQWLISVWYFVIRTMWFLFRIRDIRCLNERNHGRCECGILWNPWGERISAGSENIPGEVLERTKYMVVSYPLNPVCVCAPDHFMKNWSHLQGASYCDHPWQCIFGYYFTREQGRSFLSFDGAKEVGVEFYSLSKSYNLTGARISFVVGIKRL